MKKFSKTIVSLLIIVMLLSSCGLNKVTFSSKKVEKVDKIALISTFIEFVPPTGLLYASIMNGKINSIAEELNILCKDYTDLYRDSLALSLAKNCNCEVLYGKSLHSNPGFATVKNKFNFPDALYTEKESFPSIFQSTDDINPFISLKPFTNVKPDIALLINEKKTIQELCKNLEINYIVVSYTSLVATQGNAYARGTLSLVTVFSLFDKDGDYIAYGNKYAGGKPISAGNIEDYPVILDSFFTVIEPMVSEISKKYSNK